jgi:hypothetical protein
MSDAERCPILDVDGCRCLRPSGHQGPCDPAYTPWAIVLERRKQRRLEAIRDGAIRTHGGES